MSGARPTVPADRGRHGRSAPRDRAPADRRPLARARFGVVPITWNNADLPDLTPFVPAEAVLAAIAGLGYVGIQAGVGFPEGAELRSALEARGLRLAEVYVALPSTPDGPGPDALEIGRAGLGALTAASGEVLVTALAMSPDRVAIAGRAGAAATPRLGDPGWAALADLLHWLADECRAEGRRLAFHPHAGTYVETPDEVERLLATTDPVRVGLCLDTGHYVVGGGDPLEALRRHRERVRHIHLKDVAAEPLAGLRDGRIGGFLEVLRARIFTELGSGILDVTAVLGALDEAGYDGWIMVEQDTTWLDPNESAARSRRALDEALRRLGGAAGSGGA